MDERIPDAIEDGRATVRGPPIAASMDEAKDYQESKGDSQ